MSALEKIQAILHTNKEIIERILVVQHKELICGFSYQVNQAKNADGAPELSVIQTPVLKTGAAIVLEWQCSAQFVEIPDHFNLKPSWNVKNWKELLVLQNQLEEMNERLLLFGESQTAKQLFESIKDNFEIIQTCLGQIEGSLIPSENQIEACNTIINQINNKLAELKAQPGVSFRPPKLQSVEPTWLLDERLNVTRNVAHSGFEEQGWRFGVSSFGITKGIVDFKVTALSNYLRGGLMIGFAGSTRNIRSKFGIDTHFGQIADGWAFNSGDVAFTGSGISIHGKAPPFSTWSIIVVHINMDARTVSWAHNGSIFASMALPATITQVHPAFQLCYREQYITLQIIK